MKRRPIVFLFLAFISLQIIFAFVLWQDEKEEPLDTVMVNEIVWLAARQWDSLKAGKPFVPPPAAAGFDYTILAADETVLAASRQELSKTLHEAVARRDLIIDIDVLAQTGGKLIIHNDVPERKAVKQKHQFFIFLAISMIELTILASYFIYFNRLVMRPFYRLQAFAARIAGGDLDYPLEMDRYNVFGAFTESFDLMREELKKARIKEKEANQSKKELVAKLSHDIKTPVASIQAVSELMAVFAATDKVQQQLRVIHGKANQIDGLVSDLFHATLEELQELSVLPTEQKSVVLAELLKNADYQGQAVIEKIPECLVVFDRLRLQQVFDNIVSNSYKYAGSQMAVSFAYTESHLRIAIEDFGVGVGEDELPLLLGKYYRGKNADKKSGAGLGLFISRYLLTEMGGDILCANTEHGFCVTVLLKLVGYTR